MTEERKKLVELKNVSLTFNKGKSNEVKAINNVSFDIYEGEVFGLVGESGSGKTTVGRAILKLYEITDGEIIFNGVNITKLKGKELHNFRKDAQMILAGPDILSRGFIYMRESGDLIRESQRVLFNAIRIALKNKEASIQSVNGAIVNALRPFLYEKTEREPIIIPMVLIPDEE